MTHRTAFFPNVFTIYPLSYVLNCRSLFGKEQKKRKERSILTQLNEANDHCKPITYAQMNSIAALSKQITQN